MIQVELPGVKAEVFWSFLEYTYTDKLESCIPLESSMLLIELANRLCLPRLINIIESIVIAEMRRNGSSSEVLENCIRVLEPAQVCLSLTHLLELSSSVLIKKFRI